MKNKILTVASVLLGLMMVNGGLNKFLNYIPVPDDMPEALAKDNAALLEIEWLMPLLATAELLGGLLLFLPRTRALGALVLFPIMVGILLTHIFVMVDGLPIALFLWAILIWIMVENKHKYAVLLK